MVRAQLRTAALALMLAACAMHDGVLQPTASLEPGAAWLRTEQTEYVVGVAGGWLTIDFDLTYTNGMSTAVSVPSCHTPVRPMLQKQVDGDWVHAHSAIELMCITPPLVIPAGGTHRFRYTLRADEWDLQRWPGAHDGDIAGTYRLVWLVGRAAGSDRGAALPIERRVSNTFTVRM
jgi:hypothetical protein